MSPHRRGDIHLSGHCGELILEGKWGQVWLVLGWDLLVLGVVGSALGTAP